MATMQSIYEWKLAFSQESCAEVLVNDAFGWVKIYSHTGTHDTIFLQGDEATEFVLACDDMEDALAKEGWLEYSTWGVQMAVAQQYIENLWN